jgi:hypothetical protein
MQLNKLNNNDRITLAEAKRRLSGTPGEKSRGGLNRNRYKRMLKRGHELRAEFRVDPGKELFQPEPKVMTKEA